MIMSHIDSSNIDAIGYNPDNCTLRVRFKGGAGYDYEGVEPDVFDQFMTAPSAGKFFFKQVKSQYPYTKV